MTQLQTIFESPIGPLHLVSSEKGLQGIFWRKQKVPMAASLKEASPQARFLKQTIEELEKYFSGRLQKFTVPLDLVGTDFQKRVWAQLLKIPYGRTYSYRDIADKIQNKKAVRAVGTANGRNPISIIVPCHRVISASGALGGYAGGLPVKTQLLELEKRVLGSLN